MEEELSTLLAALERYGVVRVYDRPGRAGSDREGRGASDPSLVDPTLDLGVRSSRPDWARAQRLREAGAEGLRAVRDYATTAGCRRRALLGYFGDEATNCGGCDVCGDGGVGTASSVEVLHHP